MPSRAKYHSELVQARDSIKRKWYAGKQLYSESNIKRRPDKAERCLMVGSIPRSVPASEIHEWLQLEFGPSYSTCYRLQDGDDVIVEMASANHARETRGRSVNDYRLEYLTHHSTVYVCEDVRGLSVQELFQIMDDYDVSAHTSIGVSLQKSNGPVVAFVLGSSPTDCVFSFVFNTDMGTIEFTRARTVCEICSSEEHQVISCPKMISERPLIPPGGLHAKFLPEKQALEARLNKYTQGKQEPHRKLKSEEIDTIEEWHNLEANVKKLNATGAFLRLGHVI